MGGLGIRGEKFLEQVLLKRGMALGGSPPSGIKGLMVILQPSQLLSWVNYSVLGKTTKISLVALFPTTVFIKGVRCGSQNLIFNKMC